MAARKRKARTATGRFKKGWTITRSGRAVKCHTGARGKRGACYKDGTGKRAAASVRARVNRRFKRVPKTSTWGYMLGARKRRKGRKGRRGS